MGSESQAHRKSPEYAGLKNDARLYQALLEILLKTIFLFSPVYLGWWGWCGGGGGGGLKQMAAWGLLRGPTATGKFRFRGWDPKCSGAMAEPAKSLQGSLKDLHFGTI